MILVDIVVPCTEKTYDFKLDEEVPISLVIEEIAEMISRQEHCEMKGNRDDFLLCRFDGQVVLAKTATLKDCGIRDGYRLMLL